MPRDIQPFVDQVIAWAQNRPDVLVLALLGSYARGAARDDSDLDLLVLSESPGIYLDDRAWSRQFGEIERQQVEEYGKITSLRTEYRDGREVEFSLTDPTWAAEPLAADTRQVLAHGLRILFDRQSLLKKWEGHDFNPQS